MNAATPARCRAFHVSTDTGQGEKTGTMVGEDRVFTASSMESSPAPGAVQGTRRSSRRLRHSGDRVSLVLLEQTLRLLERVAPEGIAQLLSHHDLQHRRLLAGGRLLQSIA